MNTKGVVSGGLLINSIIQRAICGLQKKNSAIAVNTNRVVQNHDACERWRGKYYQRHKLNQTTISALDATIAELINITNILREDIENKNLSALMRERLSKRLDDIESEIEKRKN